MVNRPPLSSKSWSKFSFSWSKSWSKSLISSEPEMLVNCIIPTLLKVATLSRGIPRAPVYVRINFSISYKERRIKGVQPNINVAVLKVFDE